MLTLLYEHLTRLPFSTPQTRNLPIAIVSSVADRADSVLWVLLLRYHKRMLVHLLDLRPLEAPAPKRVGPHLHTSTSPQINKTCWLFCKEFDVVVFQRLRRQCYTTCLCTFLINHPPSLCRRKRTIVRTCTSQAALLLYACDAPT